jgi:hypothetical protein
METLAGKAKDLVSQQPDIIYIRRLLRLPRELRPNRSRLSSPLEQIPLAPASSKASPSREAM